MQISARAFKRIFTCKIWPRYSRERALERFAARTCTGGVGELRENLQAAASPGKAAKSGPPQKGDAVKVRGGLTEKNLSFFLKLIFSLLFIPLRNY